eukprot:c2894_g1_i1.p1 GENE.c2894_g1_i1~~c2894_g1_i1.p1  ORF type:complete len:240 (+),score=63.35 c2894_g1_i1:57-722(+)
MTMAGYKLDISHQEVDRILSEIEAYFDVIRESGGEWVTVNAMLALLINDLGYEDQDEFEDALHGDFLSFLQMFPHIEISHRESDNAPLFKVLPPPPPEAQKPTRLSLRIESRADLWIVCLKSQHARISIPELEFEIGSDARRQIDSVYNHIAGAMFNLNTVVRQSESMMYNSEELNKIQVVCDELSSLLDVDKPFTFEVVDPCGLSEFKPNNKVVVSELLL